MKFKHELWLESEGRSESVIIEAEDGVEAMNKFSRTLGYIDYADFAQEVEDKDAIHMIAILED